MPPVEAPEKLIKTGRLAHSGIYQYSREELPRLGLSAPPPEIGDKAMYDIYRPASVLLSAVQQGMFTHLPLTRSHPYDWVGPKNFKEEIVGWTGDKADIEYLKDSKEISVNSSVVLGDQVAIESYGQGIIDLSPGYSADFQWKKGVDPNGKPYDAIMTKVNKTNHLALVNRGRAGPTSTIIDQAARGFRKVASGLWWAVKRRAMVKDGDGSDPASQFTGFRSSLNQIYEGRASMSDEEIRDRVEQLRLLLSDLPWGDDKDVLMRFMDDLKLMKLMPEESCQTAIQVVCALFDKLDGKAVDEASLAFGDGKGAGMTKGLTLEGLLGIIARKKKGVADEEKDPKECTSCEGSGKLDGKDCADCHGTGKASAHDEETTEMNCEKCDGKGKVDGEECKTCGGSGKTSASEDTNPIGPHKVDTTPTVDKKGKAADEPDPAPAAAAPAPANPPAAAAPPAAVPNSPPQQAPSTSPNGVPIAPPTGAAPAAAAPVAAAPAPAAQSRSAYFTAQIASIIEQMMKDPGVISEIQSQKAGQAATAAPPAAPNAATPSAPPGSAGQDPPTGAAPAGNAPPGPAAAAPPGPAAAAPPGPAAAKPPEQGAAKPPGPDAQKPPEQPAAAAEKKEGAAKDEAPCEPCKGSGKIAGMECPQCKGKGKYGLNITPDPITDSASSLTALLAPSKRNGSASGPVTLENVLADITKKRR